MYGWRRREDGAVVIWDLATWPTAPVERVPMLAVDHRQAFELGEAKFHALNAAAELEYGIPEGWLAAMEYQESLFNPRAFRREPNGWTGVGLLQITHPSLKGHFTDEQLFDPAVNIGVGARHLANLIKTYGYDFPRNSAAYNAGSARPDPSNPWNLAQYGSHVSSEVSALNFYLARKQTQHEHEFVYLAGVAFGQQLDLRPDVLTPARSDDTPEPDPVREAVTVPDVALPAKTRDEA